MALHIFKGKPSDEPFSLARIKFTEIFMPGLVFFTGKCLTMPGFSFIFTNMGKLALKDTRISELVDQNYVHAYVLFYFGIRFYEYSELTLEQVCDQKGLKTEQ